MRLYMKDNHSKTRSWWQCLLDWEAGMTPRDRRNQNRFLVAMFGWALSFVGVVAALEHEWVTSGTATTAVAMVPILIGVVALLTYRHFLKEADEMTRRIQLEGLAIGFGAGAIFVMGYPILEMAGWPALPDSTPAVVLMTGWGIGQLLALRTYL
jgi:hypothetical protein